MYILKVHIFAMFANESRGVTVGETGSLGEIKEYIKNWKPNLKKIKILESIKGVEKDITQEFLRS